MSLRKSTYNKRKWRFINRIVVAGSRIYLMKNFSSLQRLIDYTPWNRSLSRRRRKTNSTIVIFFCLL